MYLFTGTATEVYVEPLSGRHDIILEDTEGLRAKGDESVVRMWDGKANDENSEEEWIASDLLESKDKVENEDDKEERLLDEENGDKKTEIEEVWSDDKEILKQKAEMENSEAKLENLMDVGENGGTEEAVEKLETVIDIEEKEDADEAVAGEEDENPDDEGAAVKSQKPDAMAYLEQLARKLAQTGEQEQNGPYHSRRIFESDYAEMKKNFKIFIYPHDHKDPFHLIFEPSNQVPSGNYASEEFFQQALMSSKFVTKDASEADFFFMPVSITKARLDKRIDVRGLQKFCANYITALRTQWNYWNLSSGADHFYLSCHSVARNAMDQVPVVKQNAIQLLCPASYFLASYITHKDASVPQIWPREGAEPKEVRLIAQRKRLAFFAGALNSPVRQELERAWSSDDKIMVHKGRVPYPYSEALLTSKFCLHAKGFEVNTARLGDAMYYGCVPVVIANHYDLPFQDILDWTKFSIVISSLDIPLLKKTLEAVTDEQYAELHSQVLQARKHFQWHNPPQEYDAFHTVMYELWKRRHIVKRSSQ